MLHQALRKIDQVIKPTAMFDGTFTFMSTIGRSKLKYFDPFLLFDEFKSESSKEMDGFPMHPHRGFETVSYMLAGSSEHRDTKGNQGRLGPGAVQWMTAGRGIMHEEIPKHDNGKIHGFQMWVNLPKKDKMSEPRYQDIQAEHIPVVTLQNGVTVKVIAGEVNGVTGAVTQVATKPTYLDVQLPPNTKFTQAVPADHNVFSYIFEGKATFLSGTDAKQTHEASSMILYERGNEVISIETQDQPARVILVSGQVIDEPMVSSGPFVMNSREELMQAYNDFRSVCSPHKYRFFELLIVQARKIRVNLEKSVSKG